MLNLGFATAIAGGLTAAVLGLAAPALADTSANAANAVTTANVMSILQTAPTGTDHHTWLDDVQPKAHAPQVDTTVHQSR